MVMVFAEFSDSPNAGAVRMIDATATNSGANLFIMDSPPGVIPP
jgi:hypothetical protein